MAFVLDSKEVVEYLSGFGVENRAQEEYREFQDYVKYLLKGKEVTAFSTLDDSEEADKFVIEATREKMEPNKSFEFDPFSVDIEEIDGAILILLYNTEIEAYGLYMINLS